MLPHHHCTEEEEMEPYRLDLHSIASLLILLRKDTGPKWNHEETVSFLGEVPVYLCCQVGGT